MRAFLAFAVPPPLADRLERCATELARQFASPIRKVPLENLHLTVAFLGDGVEPATLMQPVGEFCARESPLQARCDGLAAFEDKSGIRSIYAAIGAGRPELESFFGRCAETLGLAREAKRVPHITLLRCKPPLPRSFDLLANPWAHLTGALPCSELLLYASELRPEGPVYRVEARFPLLG